MQVSHFMIFSQFFSSWFELCQMKMVFLLLKVKDLRIPHSNLCGVLRFLTFIHHLLSFNHFIITLYHIIFYNNHLILIGLFIDQSFLVVQSYDCVVSMDKSSRVRVKRKSPFKVLNITGRCCEAEMFHCCCLLYNNTCQICAGHMKSEH